MANGKKRTSVTRIVIWMIIFFPIGIYFWHELLTEDKTDTLKNSKYSIAIGWILLIFGIISACFAVVGQTKSTNNSKSDIVMKAIIILVFIVAGAVTIKRSKKMRFLGERYQQYEDIVNAGEVTICGIAKRVSISEEEVIKDLEDMIDGGFFKGAYVDMQYKKIIFASTFVTQSRI